MTRKKVAWIWGALFPIALACPAYAQLNRGILEGSVTDPTGDYVPGVKVAVASAETNVTLRTVTNSAGYYRVVDLGPGKYKVHFEAPGFSSLYLIDLLV